MKRLIQDFNTQDDSFTYTVRGESEPTFKVDSSGYLTKKGESIGKFKLGENQWHLWLNDPEKVNSPTLFMSGPPNGLFYLPEFELKSLTELINREE